jgi:hypothetical protein
VKQPQAASDLDPEFKKKIPHIFIVINNTPSAFKIYDVLDL